MRRYAFTMLELVFVIVVMGILSKFGAEFLAQAYNGFIFSKINNELQVKSESAVEQIAARLQFRIKASVAARNPNDNNPATNFKSPIDINSADRDKYSILEWVGLANDSFRGTTTPLWSGIVDINPSLALGNTTLISPQTNTTAVDSMIQSLSSSGTTINDAAIYFVGSLSNVKNGFGWSGTAHEAMHPIKANSSHPNWLVADNNFSGVDVYEYYQLSWSAYAVGMNDWNATGNNTGTLRLWYDYRPWDGDIYSDGNSSVIAENVSTFQYNEVGSILKIQVCTKSDIGGYSLCKEKTVY